MFSAVKTKKSYDYTELCRSLETMKKRYPFCKFCSIGDSVARKKLFCIKIGEGENRVFYNGAHHGAEWITSALLMKFIEEYCEAYIEGKSMLGISARYFFDRVTLFVVPMVNPDGVDISINGARMYTADFPRLFRQNKNSSNFEKWQANFNGVDLNHNYDASWEQSREFEAENQIFGPGPTRFSGREPFSEPETLAIKRFVEKEDIKLAMAFHSQGKVIYYDYLGKEPIYSLFVANAISAGTTFKTDKPLGFAACGGFKDWFIDTYKRLCFTVEVGEGENPLPIKDLGRIYKETLPILLGGMKAACVI